MTRHHLRSGGWKKHNGVFVPPTVPGQGLVSRPDLPWDMPTPAAWGAAEKKVWGHYFLPTAPESINNGALNPANPMTSNIGVAGDYHQRHWLPPGNIAGSNEPYAQWGGYLRDRKKMATTTRPAATGWQVRDRRQDVIRSREAGIDGWIPDLVSVTPGGQRWTQFEDSIAAVEAENAAHPELPPFTINPMLDGITGATANATTAADQVASMITSPAVWRDPVSGQPVVFSFKPEGVPDGAATNTQAWWGTFFARLATLGVPSKFWACYEQLWTAANQAPTFNSLPQLIGHGRWGDATVSGSANAGSGARGAPQYVRDNFPGKKWMHYVRPAGDYRPASAKFWDGGNTRAMHNAWMAAIDGNADAMQMVTMDDYTESTQFLDSYGIGKAYTDISLFYAHKFKMGVWPTIVRDAVYVSHRRHPLTGVTYTGSQTTFAVRQGSDDYQQVEAVAFLTAPATVEILVNGSVTGTQTFTSGDISAGNGRVTVYAPQPTSGSVGARIVRSSATVASITSPTPVSTTQISQDLSYKAAGSLRGPQF